MIRRIAPVALVLLALAGSTARAQPVPDDRGAFGTGLPGGYVPVPPPSAKAVRFYQTGVVLWWINRAWDVAVPLLILATGLSARIRTLAAGRGRPWFLTVGLYAAGFLALRYALDLPLRYYSGFIRLHEYDLSVQTFGRWLGDSLKGLAVDVVGAALFLWIPYLIIARSPRRWWLYVGMLTLPFAAFTALISPVVVDPLFNDFGPMKDKALEAKIDALAHRAGIDGGKIFEVDKGRDTTSVNAYVTGLLGTKRIVLWDTLLAKLDEPEVLVVMGHEMGHYVLNHMVTGLTLASVGTILALYLIHRAAGWILPRARSRFGFDRLSDVASLPLLLLLGELTMLGGAPITNAISRHMEHEADRFALEITQTNRSAALGFAKLQQDNLAVPYPGPLYVIWRSTHPPIGERIEFCNTYRPWQLREPLRYGHLFRNP